MVALNYDDSASQFVGITLLGLYTIPAVIHIVNTIVTWKPEHKDLPKARTEEERRKLEKLSKERGVPQLWTPGFKFYVGVTVAAGLVLTALCIFAAYQGASLAGYDPFAILDVSRDATEREIKSAYRKLSLQHHPDKGGDAAIFQKIAKAYNSLTDPVARENLEKFGNPDGKQTLEVAIGIPSALIGDRGRYVFMLAYLVVLAVGIPYGMHYFWKRNEGMKDMGDFDLTISTNKWLAENLRQTPDIAAKAIPEILSGIAESVRTPFGTDVPRDAGEEAEALARELIGPGADPRNPRMARPTPFNQGVIPPQLILRNNLLLHAFLNRKPVQAPANVAVLEAILKKAHRSCEFMWVVAQMFTVEAQKARDRAIAQNNRGAASGIRTFIEALGSIPLACAQITQAVYGRDSDLLQVFPADVVPQLQDVLKLERKARSAALVGIADLIAVPREQRVSLLSSVPSVSEAQARAYAQQLDELPALAVEANYEVVGEDNIAEGDIVTLTVKVRHNNLLDRPGGSPDSPVPPVLAPRFPTMRPEQWVIYLCDTSTSTQRLIAFHSEAWEPKKAVESLTLMFMAPKSGKMSLSLHVQSMSYVGLDSTVDTVLDIAPRPMPIAKGKAAADEEEDEEVPASIMGVPEKSVEAYFGAAEDESDVSDDEDEEEGGDSDSEEGSEGRGKGGAKAAKKPLAPAKKAPTASKPVEASGAGALPSSSSGPVVAAVPAAAAPSSSKASKAVDEEEMLNIRTGGSAAGAKGKGKSKAANGQPAAKKAGDLLGDEVVD